MSVTIREAELSDREECSRLLQLLGGGENTGHTLSEGHFAQLIKGDRGAVLLAGEDTSVLGMVSISFNLALRYEGGYCQLEELIVDPSARGKNVGFQLVTSAIKRATKHGCEEIGLYLMASTEHNQPFYEKSGFQRIGSEMRQSLVS